MDKARNSYIVGNSFSADFPTVNAFQPEKGGTGQDAFVTKVSRILREVVSANQHQP